MTTIMEAPDVLICSMDSLSGHHRVVGSNNKVRYRPLAPRLRFGKCFVSGVSINVILCIGGAYVLVMPPVRPLQHEFPDSIKKCGFFRGPIPPQLAAVEVPVFLLLFFIINYSPVFHTGVFTWVSLLQVRLAPDIYFPSGSFVASRTFVVTADG
jgi:hypothetical protein